MPRQEGYVEYTVRFKRGSKTHQAILADADENAMKQIGKFLSLKIARMYEPGMTLVQQGFVQQGVNKEHPDVEVAEEVDNAEDSYGIWE